MNDKAEAGALERAGALLDLGRPEAAAELAGAYLATNPGSLRAMLITGTALAQLEREPEALRLADDALALAPENPRCWWLRATVLTAQRQWDEAVASAQRMRELAPASPDILTGYGDIMLAAGRTAPARAAVEEALRIEPDDPDRLVLLADIDATDGRWLEAERGLRTALAISPDHAEALRKHAAVRFRLGDRESATVDLARQMASAPQDRESEAHLEAAGSGLLVSPAATALLASLVALAGSALGAGLFGFTAPVGGRPLVGVAIQLVALAGGVAGIAWWLRRTGTGLGGMLGPLARNRFGTGPYVTFSIAFIALSLVLLLAGIITGVVAGDPAGPSVLVGAALCAFSGILVAGLLGVAAGTSQRSGHTYLAPAAIVLVAPGAVIMLAALIIGFVLAALYSVVYVFVPRGRLPMPFWWEGEDVTRAEQ